jgi:hypothetical protein
MFSGRDAMKRALTEGFCASGIGSELRASGDEFVILMPDPSAKCAAPLPRLAARAVTCHG